MVLLNSETGSGQTEAEAVIWRSPRRASYRLHNDSSSLMRLNESGVLRSPGQLCSTNSVRREQHQGTIDAKDHACTCRDLIDDSGDGRAGGGRTLLQRQGVE